MFIVHSDNGSFTGQLELNTIIWPTISGFLDVDHIYEEYFIIHSTLNLPSVGNVVLNDHLYYPDAMHIRNSLQMSTPFDACKEVELLYLHSVNDGHYLVSALELFYKHDLNWTELGFNANYTKVSDVDFKAQNIELNLFLPFETLPRVILIGEIEIGETVYKTSISGRALNTFISLAADFESDTNFLDIKSVLNLQSLALPHYQLKVAFKQDLSDMENQIIFVFEEDYKDYTFGRIENAWNTEANYIQLKCKVATNAFPITFLETSIVLNRSANFVALIDLNLNTLSKHGIAFHMGAKKRNDRVIVELITPMANFANVTMTTNLRRIAQTKQYLVTGRLTQNHEIYNVNGTVEFNSNIPIRLDLLLRPVARDAVTFVAYTLNQNSKDQAKIINIRISEFEKFFEVNSVISIFSKFSWNILTTINASPGLLSKRLDMNHCTFKTALIPNNDGKYFGDISVVTPWRSFGIDNLNANGTILTKPNAGDVDLFFDFGLAHGKVFASWTYIALENIQALFDYRSETAVGIRTLKLGMKYNNRDKTYKSISFGGHADVDSKMNLESNGSVALIDMNNMMGNLAIRLPAPIDDVHKFSASYRGNIQESPIQDIFMETKYESDKQNKRFISRAQYRNLDDLQTLVHAQWGTNTQNKTIESHLQMLRKGVRRELSARVKTPYYEEDTILASGFYDNDQTQQIFE